MTGLGIDLVEIARIEKAIERAGFLERIYTPSERALGGQYRKKRQLEYWAGRWAAKEATAKALGVGFGSALSWQEIEIQKNSLGAPEVKLKGKALELAKKQGSSELLVSITHTKELALAIVVAKGGN